jgi:S1-C subfamily serine protease
VNVTPSERKEDASATGARAFGFEVVPLTAEVRRYSGIDKDGLLVLSVVSGGVAERAGLRRNDRLVRVGGVDVPTEEALGNAVENALRRLAAGESVTVDVEREGAVQTFTLYGK